MAAETAQPFPAMGFYSFQVPQATIGDVIGLRQREMMEAVSAYNAAIDAARVLEPHVDRVRVVVQFEGDEPQQDEGDRCACGQVH